MPVYTIELPDGRTMRAEAGSEAEALEGAQSWWAQQQAGVTDTPGSDPAAGSRAAAELQDYRPELPLGPQTGEAAGTDAARAPLGGFLRSLAQGLTFNYGDEAEAAIRAPFSPRSRQEILDEVRAEGKQYAEDFPSAAGAGEIGGVIAGAALPVGGISRALAAVPGIPAAARGILGMTAGAAAAGGLDATGRIEGEAGAGEYATEAAKGAIVGGGIAGLLGGAGHGLARVAGPWANEMAQRLTQRGVRLTPGEILGGRAKSMEDSAAAFPILGDMIRRRGREGVESLNRVAYGETLDPLGVRYQRMFDRAAPRLGNESVDEISNILERRYETVVPKMSARVDQTLIDETKAIADALPASVRPEFVDAITRYVDRLLNPETMTLTGRDLQQTLRSLRETARRYQRSTTQPWHAEFGEALDGLREAIQSSMTRHSAGRDVTAFRNINDAYARYVRVRDAAGRVGSDEGVFSPANLHSAVRAADSSVGKGRTARGRALLQDLSGPARSVMKAKGAGSPTAERVALFSLIANPALALKAATVGLPAAALYTRAGNRIFQRAATAAPGPRAAIRAQIEDIVRRTAPGAGYASEHELMD
jgi:hypothetical protein